MNMTIDYMKQLVSFRKKGIPVPKGWRYSCIEDFVLRNGKSYIEIVPFWNELMKPQNCYGNAFEVSLANKGLTYVEGYARKKRGISTLHAWCITKDEKVIDPTWNDGVEYFGVPFKKKFVKDTVLRRKLYGILDDWQSDWPLLKGLYKSEYIAK